jgi:nucleotide-binding universal stress UspA family protein
MADIVKKPRIVVGIDGSQASRLALRWAVRQAELTGATVDAIHTWDMPAFYGVVPVTVNPDELEKAAEEVVASTVLDVVGAHPPVSVRSRVAQGNPAAVLIRAARDAELLVVGSRGHGGFVGALLGSVGQHCVHHAPCPVVVIRGPHG